MCSLSELKHGTAHVYPSQPLPSCLPNTLLHTYCTPLSFASLVCITATCSDRPGLGISACSHKMAWHGQAMSSNGTANLNVQQRHSQCQNTARHCKTKVQPMSMSSKGTANVKTQPGIVRQRYSLCQCPAKAQPMSKHSQALSDKGTAYVNVQQRHSQCQYPAKAQPMSNAWEMLNPQSPKKFPSLSQMFKRWPIITITFPTLASEAHF